jgi:hypothetical protein
MDPLAAKYPYWTPYAFSGNRVIDMIELEGLEPTTPPTNNGPDVSAPNQSGPRKGQITNWAGIDGRWQEVGGTVEIIRDKKPSRWDNFVATMWRWDHNLKGNEPDNYNRIYHEWGGLMFLKSGEGGSGSPFMTKKPFWVQTTNGDYAPGMLAKGAEGGLGGAELLYHLAQGIDGVVDATVDNHFDDNSERKPVLQQSTSDKVLRSDTSYNIAPKTGSYASDDAFFNGEWYNAGDTMSSDYPTGHPVRKWKSRTNPSFP